MITGVGGQWGRLAARRLLAEPGVRLLGVDCRAPEWVEPGVDFIKADVRNPLMTELLRAEQVDTVVHLALRERQWRREYDFESNVLGAMHLLGACAAAGVSHVLFKSTMAVYGALPENPMYVPESWPLNARSSYAWITDALEIERFIQEFSVEYPEMRIAVLRFGNIAGAEVTTPFTRLLSLPVLPSLLGFDPLLQVIDAADVIEALAVAALAGAHGPFNIAAPGVTPLCQVAGLLGRPVLPLLHWPVYWGWGAATTLHAGRRALRWFPLEPAYLRFPWTGDLTRMKEELGFIPRRTAVQVIEHYVEARRVLGFQAAAELRQYAADHLEQTLRRRADQRRAAQSR
jgi:UDP-glucose 4-epimerase